MAETDGNPQRLYVFWKPKNAWVVTYCDDPGLQKAMEQVHARVENSSKGLRWFVAPDRFDDVHMLLDTCGYREYQQAAQNTTQAAQNTAQAAQNTAQAAQNTAQAGYAVASSRPAYTCVRVAVPPQDKIYSVAEINRIINQYISDYPFDICVEGEIADYRQDDRKGYLIISLVDTSKDSKRTSTKVNSDNRPKLQLIFWSRKRFLERIAKKPDDASINGTVVRVIGHLRFYEKGGQIQLDASELEVVGTDGLLAKRKLEIEEILRREGIHDANKIIPLPFIPLRLAVFSQSMAYGFRDLQMELEKSGYPFRLKVFTINLQGTNTRASFLEAYQNLLADGLDNFDVGIIVRGGGSSTDLGCFNDVDIARTVAKSPLKFLIGLGHDDDRCILDEIAERYSTPSLVATCLVRQLDRLQLHLDRNRENLSLYAQKQMRNHAERLQRFAEKSTRLVTLRMAKEKTQLDEKRHEIERKTTAIQNTWERDFERTTLALREAARGFIERRLTGLREIAAQIRHDAEFALSRDRQLLDTEAIRIQNAAEKRIRDDNASLLQASFLLAERARNTLAFSRTDLEKLATQVDLLNPRQIFARGFVALTDSAGNPVFKLAQIAVKDKLAIHMEDGRAEVTVRKVIPMQRPQANDDAQ